MAINTRSSIKQKTTELNHIKALLLSEDACLLTWPENICATQHTQIMQCKQQLHRNFKHHLIDIVVSYNSLMIYYDFMSLTSNALIDKTLEILDTLSELNASNPKTNQTEHDTFALHIEIPVYFGDDVAWDLAAVCQRLNLTKEAFIELYSQQCYQAYALGFTPGFCYLGSLHKKLQLPRRSSPRLNIPAGALAIAEEQTAIYPTESPGGWHIIGRTPVPLYAIQNNNFIPKLPVGHSVKFTQISQQEFNRLSAFYETNTSSKPLKIEEKLTSPTITLMKVSGIISAQDKGRTHAQHLGFGASGACDEYAYLSANNALGNELTATALELFIFTEIILKCNDDCQVFISGADPQAKVNDKPTSHWQVLSMNKGDTLQLQQPLQGKVTYISISGGFNLPKWLGSASQNVNEKSLEYSHTLQEGAHIPFHDDNRSKANTDEKKGNQPQYPWHNFYGFSKRHKKEATITLRFIPTPLFLQLPLQEQNKILEQAYDIKAESNRMGYRLKGKSPCELPQEKKRLSKPVTFGTVQLPPDGQPIILMKDRQTIGGYPVLGVVMKTDLFRLSQCHAGDKVHFAQISLSNAQSQLAAFYFRFKKNS